LEPGGDHVLAEDDDSGTGFNARLLFTPQVAGSYRIRVIGVFPTLTGTYSLRIERAPPLPDPHLVNSAPESTTTWISLTGQLKPESPAMEGRYFEDYLVRLGLHDELYIRLDSSDFDPLIQVLSATNREGSPLASDDDSGPGTNSLLLFNATEAGDYVIRVTSFGPNKSGSYRLRIGR
jgi:hypothetical protein